VYSGHGATETPHGDPRLHARGSARNIRVFSAEGSLVVAGPPFANSQFRENELDAGGYVILHCNFEELRALASGAELLLGSGGSGSAGAVAAPSEVLAPVSSLQPRLTASLEIETLHEQRWVRTAVAAICAHLRESMDAKVLEFHPAHEEAVALYFEYAHTFGVLKRLEVIGAEMSALIELITGSAPSEEAARTMTFPD
jgi:hypothetical protein